MCSTIKFRKTSPQAYAPRRAYAMSAGLDLRAAYGTVCPAHGVCLVKTDLQVKVPNGTYARIAPRSGNALHHQISVGGGVVDDGYLGEVGVILFNHSPVDFVVGQGDCVAQIITEKIEYPVPEEDKNLYQNFEERKSFLSWLCTSCCFRQSNNIRGQSGFGSSGQ